MALATANYGFLKPGTGETADITVLDTDLDKVDAAITDPMISTGVLPKDAQGVVSLTDDLTAINAIGATETLLTILSSVNLVSGRTYRIGLDLQTASTSTGTNLGYIVTFKTSATSDNTVAGTALKQYTHWTAPVATSGKDDFFEHTFKATSTGAVNVKCTLARAVGTDTASSGHRNFYVEDCGSRV